MKPISGLGPRCIVKNISNENITVLGYLLKRGVSVDLFAEIDGLTEQQVYESLTDSSGDLYIETSVKNRLYIIDVDLNSYSLPLIIYGHNDRVVFKRAYSELTNRTFSPRGDFFDPAVVKTLYVSVDGDDITGDGSPTNPFRQPQAAIDFIRSAGGTPRGKFIIQCGPGEFQAPFMEWASSGDAGFCVAVVGDRSSPVASDVTFSPTPGYLSRSHADIGEYDFSVGDGTHWVEQNHATNGIWGAISIQSSSPTLSVVPAISGGRPAIHPIVTTLAVERVAGHSMMWNAFFGPLRFVGVEVDLRNSYPHFSGVAMLGCRIKGRPVSSWIRNSTLSGCSASGPLWLGDGCTVSGLRATDFIYLSGRSVLWSVSLNKNGGYAFWLRSIDFTIGAPDGETSVSVNNIDCEGTASLFDMREGGTVLLGDVNLIGSIPSIAHLGRQARIQRPSFVQPTFVTGTNPTGNAFILSNGAQINGMKEACASLTPGGNAVVCGEVNVATFADLPKNDFAVGDNSQGCRAS